MHLIKLTREEKAISHKNGGLKLYRFADGPIKKNQHKLFSYFVFEIVAGGKTLPCFFVLRH